MKLRMPPGCDSVTHGPNGYVVSNIDQTVEVPDHVGFCLLATGAGAVRIDAATEPEDFVAMRHPCNALQPLSSRGRTYHPEGGKIHVHAVAVADAIRAGFILAE